jgi:hypothetical protein
MTRKLIGLAGKAGAGKDFTYADMRDTSAPNAQIVRVAFADGLKLDIEETLERKLPTIYQKPYKPEVRALLQWWGTELRRAQDENYWVNKGLEIVDRRFAEGAHLVVITDVRFRNEAEAIRRHGGFVAEVRADDDIRAKRLGGTLPPAHASEEIDFVVDAVIRNNGGMPEYPQALLDYLHDLAA